MIDTARILEKLGLAYIARRLHYPKAEKRGLLSFIGFVFPKAIYTHRSSWHDIQMIVINQLFSPLSMALAALATGALAAWVSQGLATVWPAQHQIHHALAPQHWDKNFGQIFAIWDWLFGTLYVAGPYEELTFGLHDAPSKEHAGIWGGLLRPVWRALRVASGRPANAAEAPTTTADLA